MKKLAKSQLYNKAFGFDAETQRKTYFSAMLDGSDPKDSVYERVLVGEILVVNTNYRPLFSVWDP